MLVSYALEERVILAPCPQPRQKLAQALTEFGLAVLPRPSFVMRRPGRAVSCCWWNLSWWAMAVHCAHMCRRTSLKIAANSRCLGHMINFYNMDWRFPVQFVSWAEVETSKLTTAGELKAGWGVNSTTPGEMGMVDATWPLDCFVQMIRLQTPTTGTKDLSCTSTRWASFPRIFDFHLFLWFLLHTSENALAGTWHWLKITSWFQCGRQALLSTGEPWDLVDIDAQGWEKPFLEGILGWLQHRVRRLHISTHTRKIHWTILEWLNETGGLTERRWQKLLSQCRCISGAVHSVNIMIYTVFSSDFWKMFEVYQSISFM